MKMGSDVHHRVGTPHLKMCSDVHCRVGTPHMKMCSDVHHRVGTRVFNRIIFHFPVSEGHNRVDNRIAKVAKIIG